MITNITAARELVRLINIRLIISGAVMTWPSAG